MHLLLHFELYFPNIFLDVDCRLTTTTSSCPAETRKASLAWIHLVALHEKRPTSTKERSRFQALASPTSIPPQETFQRQNTNDMDEQAIAQAAAKIVLLGDEMAKAIDKLNKRVAGTCESIGARCESIEAKCESIEANFDECLACVEEKLAKPTHAMSGAPSTTTSEMYCQRNRGDGPRL